MKNKINDVWMCQSKSLTDYKCLKYYVTSRKIMANLNLKIYSIISIDMPLLWYILYFLLILG